MATLSTSQASQSDLQFEIAHLLLIDIVAYSKLLVNEQIEAVQELSRVVRTTQCFRKAEAIGKLIRVPTGDGMALIFFQSPEEPVRCALEIAEALKGRARLRLRMGIHSGPVNQMRDVNDQVNVAGAGINVAQRVMDCADADHILVSGHVANDLAQYGQWRPFLQPLGDVEVKHGLRFSIFNLCKDGVGNPAIPDKLRRRGPWKRQIAPEVRPIKPSRWSGSLVIGLIVFALGCIIFASWIIRNRRTNAAALPDRSSIALSTPDKSVAVLPFDNLSTDQDYARFADAVQDEILTDLAKVADLKVISRTSVMQYRSGAERNLRAIARDLGVAHVLEGTVQTIGHRVRVRAQLIDARTDTHLWAERYDRDIADVFTVESEIAQNIVAQLKSRMSAAEKTAIEERPTSDLVAYSLYTQAKSIIGSTALTVDEAEKFFEAEHLLNAALARDPGFFLAYCRLARIHDRIYLLGIDHTPARLALADAAIKQAMQLKPDAGEVHLAAATHLYSAYRNYDRASDEVQLATRFLPNESSVYEITGYIERRRGHWDGCISNLQHALTLDPLNRNLWIQLSLAFQSLRRFNDMAASLDRAISVAPDDATIRVQRALVDLASRADTAPIHSAIEALRKQKPNAVRDIARTWLYLALCERDHHAAQDALAVMTSDECRQEGVPLPSGWCEGLAARARGDSAAARAAFTAARLQLEEILKKEPNYPEALCALGLIDAGLGNKEGAISEGRRAVELLPIDKDAINGALLIEYLAVIYNWTGDRARALEQLRSAAAVPSDLNYGDLKLHPFWDGLRAEPRFGEIVKSVAPKSE